MELVDIKEVKPNPKNPRFIRDEKFRKLVRSIEEFPDMLNKRPLVVFTDKDGKYVVLGGNMRLRALQELKIKEVPIIKADEWTEEQKNEFLIKDNVGFGDWDWDQLANEWDGGLLTDWGLDVPSYFEETSLDGFFNEPEPEDEKASNKIILEYPEDECAEIKTMLLNLATTPEDAVKKLLDWRK